MNHKQTVQKIIQEVFTASPDSYRPDINISALHTSEDTKVRQAQLELLAKRLCEEYPSKDIMELAETSETVADIIQFLEE